MVDSFKIFFERERFKRDLNLSPSQDFFPYPNLILFLKINTHL